VNDVSCRASNASTTGLTDTCATFAGVGSNQRSSFVCVGAR
jgi:hypothetical protein